LCGRNCGGRGRAGNKQEDEDRCEAVEESGIQSCPPYQLDVL
jgi:hypothetical protein